MNPLGNGDGNSLSNVNGPATSTGGARRRGFASMDPERQREIASLGGRVAHQKGTAHQFSSAEAREAGRKGGAARAKNRKVT